MKCWLWKSNCEKLEIVQKLEIVRKFVFISKFKKKLDLFFLKSQINLKNETSKYVITSVDDPKLSWKLKNFLYDHKIVFNEIRMKSSNLRSVETKSNASFYNKKHMTYKELIKMIIKWKQRSVKSCDVSKVSIILI